VNWLLSRDGRKWVYGVALVAVPLLVLYGVIEEDSAPLWIALIGAVVAPSMALTHLTPAPVEPDDLTTVPEDMR
jgi:hypothetical protein